jgi:hypothetical protein
MLDDMFDDTILDHVVQALVQNEEFLQLIDTASFSPSRSRHKRTRVREKRRFATDYTQTNWGKFIEDPTVADPYSKKGKLFRRRFRVPFLVYVWICRKCEETNVFEVKRKASVEIPISIKVLICLRILGRGDCCDSISEFCEVSEAHVRLIFLQFVRNFRKHFQSEFIKIPQGEELTEVMSEYSLLGLPGTVGSCDVTHVFLDKCPSQFSNLCNGKEGKPTLAFEVVVSHRKRILSISKGEYGSYNDKTICRMDPFVSDIMYGRIMKDVESFLYDSNGNKIVVKGVHLVTDNGYHKVPGMICPMMFRTGMQDVFWSEWLESVRKDVECTFGILKQRFRILKNSFQYHSLDTLEDVFVVHNILITVDDNWESSVQGECGASEDKGIVQGNDVVDFEDDDNLNEVVLLRNTNLVLTSNVSTLQSEALLSTTTLEYQRMWSQYDLKVQAMVHHFTLCYNQGELRWMKTHADGSKGLFPV